MQYEYIIPVAKPLKAGPTFLHLQKKRRSEIAPLFSYTRQILASKRLDKQSRAHPLSMTNTWVVLNEHP